MVAKLVLDEISSSGAGITIDSTKTFTVNGTLLTTGSTNIIHKTVDYTIVTGDVASKSELVVTATTAGPRNITLPGLAVAGASTCVITIMVSADATGTDSLRVQEGTTEVWTGYQKGDFVRLCISDGAWVVLDHKETYYSRRYLTANQSLSISVDAKLTTWTNVSEIGNAWDNANDKLVTPTGMNGYWTVSFNLGGIGNYFQIQPYLVIGGVTVSKPIVAATSAGYMGRGTTSISGHYYAAATEAVEFYASNYSTDAGYPAGYVVAGGALSKTHFTAQFNRVY